jgi:hypothetical protein
VSTHGADPCPGRGQLIGAFAWDYQLVSFAIIRWREAFGLAISVIFHVLPWMDLELLDTARAVAEFDPPMSLLTLWWGNHR